MMFNEYVREEGEKVDPPVSFGANERIKREKQAYDSGKVWENNDRLHRRFRHVFECPNTLRGEKFLEDLVARVVPGSDVLDYGCYDGWMTPVYARANPRGIVGIDISEKAIADAKAMHGNVAKFYVADAHRLALEDASFDVVIGRSILHHLNYEIAIQEICRILRPGGYAVFVEPLGDNPAAKLFRALTPSTRTSDEKALSKRQIRWADQIFGSSEHLYINLLSTPLALMSSLLPVRPDTALLRAADRVDVLLARTSLRYWMRSVCLVWQKRKQKILQHEFHSLPLEFEARLSY